MRVALALVRASWLTQASYRVGVVLSFLALVATVVPVYFVADALQPVVASSIRDEGERYFGFLVVGLASLYLVGASVSALPQSISSGIHSGTLEALFSTRASVTSVMAGLAGFPLLWAGLRAGLLFACILPAGIEVHWARLPTAAVAVLLTVAAYIGVGLFAAALILVFRTAGPLIQGVLAASSLLGGVYYSTSVIPEPFGAFAHVVPLTYGLRIVRQGLFEGAPLAAAGPDGVKLAILAGVMLLGGVWCFRLALLHSKRAGSLGQY